jgi:hypothetical protein
VADHYRTNGRHADLEVGALILGIAPHVPALSKSADITHGEHDILDAPYRWAFARPAMGALVDRSGASFGRVRR